MKNLKHVIGYGATAVVALGIGAASASGGGSGTAASAASTPAPTVTVHDSPAPADTVTETATVTAPAKTVTVKAKPKGPSATINGDGTYAVGKDIKAGTYVSPTPDSGNCYWARLQDTNGDINSILANNNSSGQSLVTIRPTDKFFETSGCNTWTRR